jgi:1-acyl-sn-glycerol-3-phosphate acyltransferase
MSAVATRSRTRARTVVCRDTRLYDLVALSLSAYVHACYRVRVLGAPFALEERLLVVSSHRSDDDIPLVVGGLYRQAHGLLRRNPGVHFAVRDDLFEPGFFVGY